MADGSSTAYISCSIVRLRQGYGITVEKTGGHSVERLIPSGLSMLACYAGWPTVARRGYASGHEGAHEREPPAAARVIGGEEPLIYLRRAIFVSLSLRVERYRLAESSA